MVNGLLFFGEWCLQVIGDMLKVNIVENLKVEQQLGISISCSNQMVVKGFGGSVKLGFFDLLFNVNVSVFGSDVYIGSGKVQVSGSFQVQFVVLVINVLLNGYLLVVGEWCMGLDVGVQVLCFFGVVDLQDICFGNQVDLQNVVNVSFENVVFGDVLEVVWCNWFQCVLVWVMVVW